VRDQRLKTACSRLKHVVLAGIAASAIPLFAQQSALRVQVDADGRYSIGSSDANAFTLTACVAAKVNGRWLHYGDYPHHDVTQSTGEGYLGATKEWMVMWTGLQGEPDLIYHLRAYSDKAFADLEVRVHNSTGAAIHVQAIRAVEGSGNPILDLGGPAVEDRVLSDSFSEDRPAMKIHDLADAKDGMHRAVGSQLIYNRESHQSLFLGVLTSEKFLTILRLHVDSSNSAAPRVTAFEADSTGTTELELENSLEHSPPQDRVELSLPVAPGEDISSERLLFSVSKDYHEQLDTYGSLIRQIHHARVDGPPLLGWWSWTAFYFGLNQGSALTNAEWESQHLKRYGYDLFHIDEGYMFARGEYVTPDASKFPSGLTPVEYQIRGLGLTPGIWTAPFEVSERSSIFHDHPDWLVKNAEGQPIHAGFVDENKDQLYVLDTTNPGAQAYLRETYSKLVRQWGIHYIKMDFMDDTAIEGYHYKPDTTAMEAQRIGLQIIRDTVGDDVLLDKDGSVMLNPVGYVDYGRISQDTGHTFDASHDAVTGIAARYYMNRNYFISDPDAFTVSTQTIPDQTWHEGANAASLNEAQVSIALAAVSGGMFEIGDNLPSLQNSPERLALIEDQDLIDMIRLGRASKPIDLLSYAPADEQPSIFYLKESDRQSILSLFNWTEKPTQHTIRLADLGLAVSGRYAVWDVLKSGASVPLNSGEVHLELPPHSVRVLKIVDQSVSPQKPAIHVDHPDTGKSGEEFTFSAQQTGGDPVISYRWNFGDGIELEGRRARHAWTEPGDYTVHLTATGIDATRAEETFTVHITGKMPTDFNPGRNRRLEEK
jgi:alpha-galactosidase